MASTNKRMLSYADISELMDILEKRFLKNKQRHSEISWEEVAKRLKKHPDKIYALHAMEHTGGEPDVVGKTEDGAIIFYDCSPETPDGRRNLCYDRKALDERKTFKPANSALDLAEELGITMLTEEDYHFLQTLGAFDTKTSSWVLTPPPIRSLGGALFGDRRFNHVFIYHNGAQSYYAVRGFRGKVTV